MSNTPSLPANHAERMSRAAVALDGLSVGDALGETCFRDHNWARIQEDPHAVCEGPWPWTDDTAMALGILEVLEEHGRIDQDALARRFASRWQAGGGKRQWEHSRGQPARIKEPAPLTGRTSCGVWWRRPTTRPITTSSPGLRR